MPGKTLPGGMAVALLLSLVSLVLTGCDKSKASASAAPAGASSADGGSGKDGSASSAMSPLDREARDTAMAEVAKRWTKGPDGWTSALNNGNDFAPIPFLRQFRDLTVDHVDPDPIGEADRLNGFEWAGEVSLSKAPAREAGEPGVAFEGMANVTVMRQRGRWTQWVEYQPMPLRLQKVHGKWQTRTDNTLVSGHIPTPADYANAGVK